MINHNNYLKLARYKIVGKSDSRGDFPSKCVDTRFWFFDDRDTIDRARALSQACFAQQICGGQLSVYRALRSVAEQAGIGIIGELPHERLCTAPGGTDIAPAAEED